MDKRIICFTPQGKKVVDRINRCFIGADIEPAKICHELDTFVKDGFADSAALIFVGAVGIAVRAVAPYVRDKLTDSPVIVLDDNGRFVIPILSGHAGGANKLAVMTAKMIGAVPVITTSTDVNGAFSADVFAVENNLKIKTRDGIRKVSAKALEGKSVTISVKDYPPRDRVDIIIADETDREYDMLLSPKRYTLGIGLKKGKDPSELESFVLNMLGDNGINTDDIFAVCTVDIKENEPALKFLRDKYRIPLITFEASVLERLQGDFSSSEFVKNTVGVDNVCERAAVLGAGEGAKLIVPKTAGSGMTAAIAIRNVRGKVHE